VAGDLFPSRAGAGRLPAHRGEVLRRDLRAGRMQVGSSRASAPREGDQASAPKTPGGVRTPSDMSILMPSSTV
jgi:hypothetical protein